jgi:hypothetical protein
MHRYIRLSYILFFTALSYSTFAQNVGINTTGNPANNSAMLDVESSDKGVLIPRVALLNVTNGTSPINIPAGGLLVYNTNNSIVGGFGVGFYYWSGVAWTKIATGNPLSATLANGRVWVGDGSNTPTEQLISGDGTISNTGVLDLNNSAVETSEINDLAVTTVKIADNNVTTAKILDANVTTSKIANNAVDGTKINIASTAHGDLMYYDGTDWVRLAAAGSGTILRSNGPGFAPSWTNVNALIGSGVQNYVAKWTTGGTQLTSSQIFDNGTDVGIGVSPLHKLDVQSGNIRASSQNTMIGTHPTYGSYSAWWREGSDYSILTEGTNLLLNAPLAAGNIYLRTANADKVFIRGSDGFVGIGNSGPSQKRCNRECSVNRKLLHQQYFANYLPARFRQSLRYDSHEQQFVIFFKWRCKQ